MEVVVSDLKNYHMILTQQFLLDSELIIVSQCASTNTVRVISDIFILVLTTTHLIFLPNLETNIIYLLVLCMPNCKQFFFGKYDTKRMGETCVFDNFVGFW